MIKEKLASLALLLVLIPSSSVVVAVASASPCPGGESTDCTSSSPEEGSGNPINVITGNKYQREVDYEAAGGVASLLLKRHYNSLNVMNDTGLGLGWRHSFDVRLTVSRDLQTYQIIQNDGRRIVFKRDNKTGVAHAVSPSDGVIGRSGKRPMWSLPNGRRIIFYGIFPTQIIYPGERTFTLKYKGVGSRTKLSQVIDHQGRVLKFNYSAGNTAFASFSEEASNNTKLAGHLESVTLPDDGVITYQYDTEHNLSKVIYPDNTSRIYHYENIGFPNHLTGITDRTGTRFATWGYNDEGRANLSSHASDVEKVTLEYKIPEQAGKLGSTVLTNSLGQTSTYTWKYYPRVSQSLLISSEGPGCSNCPSPNKRYTYDDHYQLATTTDTKTGDVIRYSRDKQGRMTKVSKMAGGAVMDTT